MKYLVYGIISASKFIGEFEAESKEKAIEMAENSENCYTPGLCHQCSGEINLGDIYEIEAEEATP